MSCVRWTEHGNDRVLWRCGNIPNGANPELVELAFCDPTDTPQVADGKGVKKLELLARVHHNEPVGLCHLTRNLGKKLARCGTDRHRKTRFGLDVGTN